MRPATGPGPAPAAPMPRCSRCPHLAAHHEHDPLACAQCALSARAHAAGLGCGSYAPRDGPAEGARCNVPGCDCRGGYREAL